MTSDPPSQKIFAPRKFIEDDPERDRPTVPPPAPLPVGLTVEHSELERRLDQFDEMRDVFARWSVELLDEGGMLDRIACDVRYLRERTEALPRETDEKLTLLKNALEHKFESKIGELRDELTSVKLRLGLAEERESGRMSVAPASSDGTPFGVLVVDDNDDVRVTISRVLEAFGFLVLEASSGNEAIELLEQYKVDTVLTDLRMPGNGSTLMRHVREHYPKISAVLMTAYDSRDAARMALEAGAFHYLTKPFQDNETLNLTLTRASEYARARARK